MTEPMDLVRNENGGVALQYGLIAGSVFLLAGLVNIVFTVLKHHMAI
ncbi:hypothetical protein [Pseudodesulfovibrio sp.]